MFHIGHHRPELIGVLCNPVNTLSKPLTQILGVFKLMKGDYQIYFDATMAEIDEWCRLNCKGLYKRSRYSSPMFEFALKEDAALFTMIWGEIDIN